MLLAPVVVKPPTKNNKLSGTPVLHFISQPLRPPAPPLLFPWGFFFVFFPLLVEAATDEVEFPLGHVLDEQVRQKGNKPGAGPDQQHDDPAHQLLAALAAQCAALAVVHLHTAFRRLIVQRLPCALWLRKPLPDTAKRRRKQGKRKKKKRNKEINVQCFPSVVSSFFSCNLVKKSSTVST
jgi:hypothetical protein